MFNNQPLQLERPQSGGRGVMTLDTFVYYSAVL